MMAGGSVILKLIKKMVRKISSASAKNDESTLANDHDDLDQDDDEIMTHNILPDDVKEGHFAVQTVEDGELRRFVVNLSCLTHPGFLKLLEKAEEEYGFEQRGVLAVPCRCDHLQTVLESIDKN